MYQNSPIAMPGAQIQPDEQPHDLMSWLKKTLLGGSKTEQLDPNMSSLLKALLSQSPEQGQTI